MARASAAAVPPSDPPVPVAGVDPLPGPGAADPAATAVLVNEGFAPTWAQLASGLVRLAAKESLTVPRADVTAQTRLGAARGDFSIRIP